MLHNVLINRKRLSFETWSIWVLNCTELWLEQFQRELFKTFVLNYRLFLRNFCHQWRAYHPNNRASIAFLWWIGLHLNSFRAFVPLPRRFASGWNVESVQLTHWIKSCHGKSFPCTLSAHRARQLWLFVVKNSLTQSICLSNPPSHGLMCITNRFIEVNMLWNGKRPPDYVRALKFSREALSNLSGFHLRRCYK